MKSSKIYTVPYRRKRQGKTNYRKRIKLLLASEPRLVVRKSLSNVLAQIVEYSAKGDKILISAHSNELKKLGWKYGKNNVPACYLVGLLLGKKAKDKKVKDAVLDLGLQMTTKGSKLYAVVKGAIDSGINIPCNQKVLPNDDRLSGKHISSFKKDEGIVKAFNELKSKIAK